MIIGVDNGNVQTKTLNFTFKSGVMAHDLKPNMAGGEVLLFNNKYYTLQNKRAVYQKDKTQNDDCFILTLFAIAKEILYRQANPNNITIDLAVGLPPGHMAFLKNRFKSYFYKHGTNITFKYNSIVFNININKVMVFPQAYSSIFYNIGELKDYSKIYVVDIGGYTTDVLPLVNGIPEIGEHCLSLEHGMIELCNKIKNRVSTKFDIMLDEINIEDVLNDKKVVFGDDIKKFIKEEALKETELILNELRELGIDLKANPSMFCGGGSLILKKYIESSKMISKVLFIDNIEANVKGYEKLAAMYGAR